MREPSPRRINTGFPPTERKARTGLLTPPGDDASPAPSSVRSGPSPASPWGLCSLHCHAIGFSPFDSSAPVLYLGVRMKLVRPVTLGDRLYRPESSNPIQRPYIKSGRAAQTRIARLVRYR